MADRIGERIDVARRRRRHARPGAILPFLGLHQPSLELTNRGKIFVQTSLVARRQAALFFGEIMAMLGIVVAMAFIPDQRVPLVFGLASAAAMLAGYLVQQQLRKA